MCNIHSKRFINPEKELLSVLDSIAAKSIIVIMLFLLLTAKCKKIKYILI